MPIRLILCIKLIVLGILVLSVAGCAEAAVPPTSTVEPPSGNATDAPISSVSSDSGRIWLQAPTGNFQTGWSNLWEADGSLFVDISVSPSEPVAQPAHIHVGSCIQLGGIKHYLENVVGGRSLTELPGVTIEDVATGGMAINIHRSFADFPTFTACGDIPALEDSVQPVSAELPDLAD